MQENIQCNLKACVRFWDFCCLISVAVTSLELCICLREIITQYYSDIRGYVRCRCNVLNYGKEADDLEMKKRKKKRGNPVSPIYPCPHL